MSSEECPQGCEHSEKDREKEGSWFSDEVMSCDELFAIVYSKFNDVDYIFSKEGVPKDRLLLTMQYTALATQHEIQATYPGAHSVIFHCGLTITKPRKGWRKSEKPQVFEVQDTQNGSGLSDRHAEPTVMGTQAPSGKIIKKKPCGFFLVFAPTKKGLWALKEDRRNCIPKECFPTSSPNICMNSSFISTFLSRHAVEYCSDAGRYRISELELHLKSTFWFTPKRTTLYEGWNLARGINRGSVLAQNQMVQDYLRQLNVKGHYGVLLYSDGELVVPSADGKYSISKSLMYQNFSGQSCPVPLDANRPFWDSLPDKLPDKAEEKVGKDEKKKIKHLKYVDMTFEAVAPAMKAIPFCIPVICLDACTIHSAHTEGVMLAATVATTEMKLLTVCFGTAVCEVNVAWDFFLANFREALRKYCPNLTADKLVFMSDRHGGIIKGVEKHFKGSHHLFCILHIIRNLKNLSNEMRCLLWKAAESIDEKEFEHNFQELVRGVPKATALHKIRWSWSRYAVAEKCRRYGVRTNNWAEIQNNAMKFLRGGSVLTVLYKSFEYTCKKLNEYHEKAADLCERASLTHNPCYTRYVAALLDKYSEIKYKQYFTVTLKGGSVWTVQRKSDKKDYDVNLDESHPFCPCLHFSETRIPCVHMLLALQARSGTDLPVSNKTKALYIDDIYLVDKLLEAFPTRVASELGDIGSYAKNLSVGFAPKPRRRGRPKTSRIGTPGDKRKKRGQVFDPVLGTEQSLQETPVITTEQSQQGESKVDETEDGEETEPYVPWKPIPIDYTFEELQLCLMDGEKAEVKESAIPPVGSDSEDDDIEQEPETLDGMEAGEGSRDEIITPQIYDEDRQSVSGRAVGCDNIGLAETEVADPVFSDENASSLSCDPEMSLPTFPSLIEHRRDQEPEQQPQPFTMFPQIEQNYSALLPDGLTDRPGFDDPQNDQPPKRKRSRKRDSRAIKQTVVASLSGRRDEMTPFEKVKFFLGLSDTSFGDWKSCYTVFCTDQARPEFMQRNHFPSPENPVPIPLIDRSVREVLGDVKPKGMELVSKLSDDEQVQVISIDVIIKFLALVHLNTAVGFQSQALAFSESIDGPVTYLCTIPFGREKSTTAGSDIYNHKKIFSDCFGGSSSCPPRFVTRCWIITHPTSSVFLSSEEIVQLYDHTLQDKQCFCVVLSPRNDGMKMLCVQLTTKGFKTIKKFQEDLERDPSFNESTRRAFLSLCVSGSDVDFYRQIRCSFSQDPCEVCDVRKTTEEIAEIKHTALSPGCVFW